ncbi:MAG: hypothetical protein Q7R65_02325 [bacterium]|nr:hypothetical protein [bacterium]
MTDTGEEQVAMPIDLRTHNGELCMVSFSLPQSNFTEPFFLDTLSRRFRIAEVDEDTPREQEVLVRPLHYDETDPRIVYTPVSEFLATHHTEKSLDKNVRFIFHMSRCGSTLAAQMLASSNRFFVISEHPLINTLLDPALKLNEKIDKGALLKASIQSILACKPREAEYSFLKFRSWNTLYLDKILEQFPTTPWMFIHRNGLEVLASVLRNPPGWLRSREKYESLFTPFLDLKPGEHVESLGDDEFAIRILGAFCKKAISEKSSMSEYVEYEDISVKFPNILDKEWGLHLSPAEQEAMMARTRIYSKDPEKMKEFIKDGEVKRQLATEEQRELAGRFIEVERRRMQAEFDWTKELRPRML